MAFSEYMNLTELLFLLQKSAECFRKKVTNLESGFVKNLENNALPLKTPFDQGGCREESQTICGEEQGEKQFGQSSQEYSKSTTKTLADEEQPKFDFPFWLG